MKVKVFRSNYTSRPSRDLQNFVLISSVVLDIEGKILTVRQQKKKNFRPNKQYMDASHAINLKCSNKKDLEKP